MIAWAHNAVPLKHFPRRVTRHLHFHPFGDPGSDQVSDRRPTEIMGDASRQPSLFASRRPSLPKVADRTTLSVKGPRDYLTLFQLELQCVFLLAGLIPHFAQRTAGGTAIDH